jgi:hypothetical protein
MELELSCWLRLAFSSLLPLTTDPGGALKCNRRETDPLHPSQRLTDRCIHGSSDGPWHLEIGRKGHRQLNVDNAECHALVPLFVRILAGVGRRFTHQPIWLGCPVTLNSLNFGHSPCAGKVWTSFVNPSPVVHRLGKVVFGAVRAPSPAGSASRM